MTTSVIAGKYVLGMRDGEQAVLQDHYVYVDGATIEAVTRDAPAAGTPVIRYEHGFVMPGFVNLHAHCIRGGLFRGIPDDLEMEPWVPKLVYNILLPLTAIAAKELTPAELRAVTALGMIDLLKGGTTTVLDMWHHGQEVFFDVARDVGLRTVGAPFIMSSSNSRLGPDGYPVWDFGNDGMAQLAQSVALFKARDQGHGGLAQVAIGPHATDTCLPELLRECRKAADDLGCILTTHFAQTPQELALLRKRYGMGAAEYAQDTGLLGRNVVLAHAGCATDEELVVLAATGTHVANCALSFAREGQNFPYARFAKAGVSTGIGTDSHGMDMIGELRVTGLLSKQFFGKAHVGTAHQLMRAGTLAGANALGRSDLGRLQAGAKADLLVFDLFKPHLQPVWDPVKNLIWKGHAGDIVFTMVHGEPVVRDGKLLKADEGAIMRMAAGAARKIWNLAADRKILPPPPVLH
jgi:cytosine/adenosine deaminase-related metal-dependent hydrolase